MNTKERLLEHTANTYAPRSEIIGFIWGKVTTPPSADPLKLDRIRVNIPPMHQYDQSDWVAYTALGQGPRCGVFMPPHIGDEVMLLTINGDIHQCFYFTHSSTKHPLPLSHIEGKPEERWLIRTPNGHEFRIWQDPENCMIQALSAAGATITIDDVPGRRRIESIDHDGNKTLLDPENDKVEVRDIGGNFYKSEYGHGTDIKISNPVGSYIHMDKDKNVEIYAPEQLRLLGKKIKLWADEELKWFKPPKFITCETDGIDYVKCPPAAREKKCYDCTNDEEVSGTPQEEGQPEGIDGGTF